jgi:hypothetical protein
LGYLYYSFPLDERVLDGVDKNLVLAGKSDADLALKSASADERNNYYANAFAIITIVQQDLKRVSANFGSKIAFLFIQLADKPTN